MKFLLSIIIILCSVTASSFAELSVSVEEIADLNPGDEGSYPQGSGIVSGDYYYFVTTNGDIYNYKFFRTDGTPENTEQILFPDNRRIYGLYLVADEAGGVFFTVQILDSSYFGYISHSSDTPVIFANNDVNGYTLILFSILNGKPLWLGFAENNEYGLFISENPLETPTKINIPNLLLIYFTANPDASSLNMYNFETYIYDELFYFIGVNQDSKIGIWETDGTAEGSRELLIPETTRDASQVYNLERQYDKLFFNAQYYNGEDSAAALICYDMMSSEQTVLTTELYSTQRNQAHAFNEDIIFFLKDVTPNPAPINNSTVNLELREQELNSTESLNLFSFDAPINIDTASPRLFEVNNNIIFHGYDSEENYTLYTYDPNSESMDFLLRDQASIEITKLIEIIPFKLGALLHVYQEETGEAIYYTEGTPETTSIFYDPSPFEQPEGILDLIAVKENEILLSAPHPQFGQELFIANDSTSVTILNNLNQTPASSSPKQFTNINGDVYFSAENHVTGRELWKYDQETDDIILFHDSYEGPADGNPAHVTKSQETLFFTAVEKLDEPSRLFMSKETPETVELFTVNNNPVTNPKAAFGLNSINNKLYFSSAAEVENELFVIDNLTTPVQLTTGYIDYFGFPPLVISVPRGSNPYAFVSQGDYLYFKRRVSSSSEYLYSLDSNTNETTFISEMSSSYSRNNFIGGDFYFYLFAEGNNNLQAVFSPRKPQGSQLNIFSEFKMDIDYIKEAEFYPIQTSRYHPGNQIEDLVAFIGSQSDKEGLYLYNPDTPDFPAELLYEFGPIMGQIENVFRSRNNVSNPGSITTEIRETHKYQESLIFSIDIQNNPRTVNDTYLLIYNTRSGKFNLRSTEDLLGYRTSNETIFKEFYIVKIIDSLVFGFVLSFERSINNDAPSKYVFVVFDPNSGESATIDTPTSRISNSEDSIAKIRHNEYLIGLNNQGNGIEPTRIIINSRTPPPIFSSNWMIH